MITLLGLNGSAERLRGKRQAAVGFDRTIESWPPLSCRINSAGDHRPSFIDAGPRPPDSLKAAILHDYRVASGRSSRYARRQGRRTGCHVTRPLTGAGAGTGEILVAWREIPNAAMAWSPHCECKSVTIRFRWLLLTVRQVISSIAQRGRGGLVRPLLP